MHRDKYWRGGSKIVTQDEFIERCKTNRGNLFDYSQVIYVSAKTKICVKCNICNNAWNVIPGNFISNKTGRPHCKIEKHKERCNKEKLSLEKFIQRSNEKHFNQYDYSVSEYINSDEKINIICPNHGIFSQIAFDHMKGRGCYKCKSDNMIKTKIKRNMIRSPEDIPEYERYYLDVMNETKKNYRKYLSIINPENHKRGKNYNLDHVFSIQQGFYLKISPKIIGHYTNLQVIPGKENRIKYIRCGKTHQQLLNDYNKGNTYE